MSEGDEVVVVSVVHHPIAAVRLRSLDNAKEQLGARPTEIDILTFTKTGYNRAPIGEKTDRGKSEKPKIQKPCIKLVRDSCLWDSGRWEIILGLIPPYYRGI